MPTGKRACVRAMVPCQVLIGRGPSGVFLCRLLISAAECPLLLRVVGHLSQTDGAASSGGRCPTSLGGGNRGPITRGGAAFYGESGIDPVGWIGRLGSTPLRRSARDGFRAAVRGLSQSSRRWMGARGGKRTGHLAERRCVWSRTSAPISGGRQAVDAPDCVGFCY